jgi:hypothetical protein
MHIAEEKVGQYKIMYMCISQLGNHTAGKTLAVAIGDVYGFLSNVKVFIFSILINRDISNSGNIGFLVYGCKNMRQEWIHAGSSVKRQGAVSM